MEEKYFKNKIIWFTFLYSLLVIWVHSYNAVLFLGKTSSAYQIDWLERFLGDTMAQIAVPGFFLISSYLFFRGFSLDRTWVKYKSRIKSVVVPYVSWNFLYYFGYVIGSRLPFLSQVIGKGKVPFTFFESVNAILQYRYNYVFWYLNQLILLIILAPLIYLIVKKKLYGGLFLGGVFATIYMGFGLSFLNLDALFYYTAGAFAAVHGKHIVEKSFQRKYLVVGIITLVSALLIRKVDFPGDIRGELAVSTVCYRLLFPAGLWLVIPGNYLKKPKDWMKQNFFLYATHFSMVRFINKAGALLLPPVPAIPFILYLTMPVICVCVSYQISRFLRAYIPAVWNYLNGGR
ncbi:acyltransferase family protein [Clostridium sp. E02]|uniref:acyltransferase family protein n=1 Tax=Clostridium sp. E02 TaxID=2487134 RepID=UPI000F5343B3|nr:acyltransferase family protein [Clostridium sp. E02]